MTPSFSTNYTTSYSFHNFPHYHTDRCFQNSTTVTLPQWTTAVFHRLHLTVSISPPWTTGEDRTKSGNKSQYTPTYSNIYGNTLYQPARLRCSQNYNQFQLFKNILRHNSQHHYINTHLSPSHSHFVALRNCTNKTPFPSRHSYGTFSNRVMYSISFPP
jgi:hypothetical protein